MGLRPAARGLEYAGVPVALLAASGRACAQDVLAGGLWSGVGEHLNVPALAGLALGVFLLMVMHRRLRREAEKRRRIEVEAAEERERLNAVLNRAGVGVSLVERDVRLFDVNHRWCEMFGYRRREARGRLSLRDVVHPEERQDIERHFRELLGGRSPTRTLERRFVRKDGSCFWGLISTSLAQDKGGRRRWCVAMITDIDARKRADEALRESEERLRFITENTQDIVWQLDGAGRFTYVNSADERLRGYPRDEVVGTRFRDLLTAAGKAAYDQAFEHAVGPVRFDVEMSCKDGHSKDGGTFWAEINAAPFHGPDGAVSGYIGVTRDATQRRQANEALREQTIRDPLTGLFNRRFLDESLDREIARARRDQQPLALLMIDIDRFKQLNDTYGHPTGDEVIRRAGELVRKGARGGDLPCRYGGEEFLLVLPNMTLNTAVARAEAWRAAFANDWAVIGENAIAVTVSIGVAVFPDHGDDREALIEAVDQALYAAKRNGRNRVVAARSDGTNDLSGPLRGKGRGVGEDIVGKRDGIRSSETSSPARHSLEGGRGDAENAHAAGW